ncbi:MMPL family transporter [Galbitalea soli]|uniref:MMPL family transporter n=1 Tax=Galbitalea soli TaxID=1268042 RepID=A0A7C9TQM0_9MICO|nr:efflux RND transporter permease subunit [Galbitalea soli]NEM91021.1 MMPL family transporter [Galbitalea soli]NYJ29708.1 RND superfamily putative drug exporter [Galbitalea soli]
MTDTTDRTTARRGTSRVPRVLRVVIPAVLILAWFAVGGVGGPYFGKISEVSSNDATSFLPASSDATTVQNAQAAFQEKKAIPAVVVFARDGGLTTADRSFIDGRISAVAATKGVDTGTSPALISADGAAAEIIVPIADDTQTSATVGVVRGVIADGLPAGLSGYVTGPAGQIADLGGAFAGIDGVLLLVAVLAVLVILIVVYRSPLLPILVLLTSVFALCASILVVWNLAKAGLLQINGQVQGILFILVIGAATDYSLLYVSRYREALRDNERRWDATLAALRGSLEPILASAGTVIVGLLCLLLSELSSNKALGPVAAIGVAFAFLAAMTLLPALLLATGRAAFWPLRPRFGSAHPRTDGDDVKGLWPRLGRGISRHPRWVWVVSVVVLLVSCLGLLQLKANGIPQSAVVLGASQARDGQDALGRHFPKGSGSPAVVLAPAASLASTAATVLGTRGVDSLAVQTAQGPLPVTADGTITPAGPPGTPAPEATVKSGRVLLQATLSDDPDSAAATATVQRLRAELGSTAPVGGVTATAIDTNAAAVHDRGLIIPVVLLVILLILMLLLRSIVAPLLLIGSVVLSFAATIGISALVFNHVFHFVGADPAVPLYGFIFLVALGVDYNIFLMTRVREESLQLGTRRGVLRGLAITGGVITSAGIVLAATFAALGVIPVMFLAQIAFIVGFGVLLDTIVVRSLLVPALAYDIGRRIWWPSKLGREVSGS